MSEIKANKTSGAGVSRWLEPLAICLWAAVGFSAHFLTTVTLLDFVVRLWMPSLLLDPSILLVTIFLPLYTIVPVFVMVAPDHRLTGKRVLLAAIGHLKLLAVILTVVVVVLIIIAPLVSSGEPVVPAGVLIGVVLAHWVSVLLIEVLRNNSLGLHKLPINPPNLTDQSDSDSDDEAGAK